jgi:hypothetical protein
MLDSKPVARLLHPKVAIIDSTGSKMFALELLPLVLLAICPTQCLAFPSLPGRSTALPRRTIAGVSVVDTQLVRDAQQYAKEHNDPLTYNHIMRSWLFGTLLLQHNSTLSAEVDAEVHAVAAILHDLGLDRTPDSPLITPDRRFEVDGAFAARDFIHGHPQGRPWDKHRVQLVWDAIALHGEVRIAPYKEPEVKVTSEGINLDFRSPSGGVTPEEHAAIMAEFPWGDLKGTMKEMLGWLCATKPETTYGECFSKDGTYDPSNIDPDTWQQPWGDRFVANYSAVGHRGIDFILGTA